MTFSFTALSALTNIYEGDIKGVINNRIVLNLHNSTVLSSTLPFILKPHMSQIFDLHSLYMK